VPLNDKFEKYLKFKLMNFAKNFVRSAEWRIFRIGVGKDSRGFPVRIYFSPFPPTGFHKVTLSRLYCIDQNKLKGVRSERIFMLKNKWSKKRKNLTKVRTPGMINERERWRDFSPIRSLLATRWYPNIYFARSQLYRMTNYDSYREYRWISEWHANCHVDLCRRKLEVTSAEKRNITHVLRTMSLLTIRLVITRDRLDTLHIIKYLFINDHLPHVLIWLSTDRSSL